MQIENTLQDLIHSKNVIVLDKNDPVVSIEDYINISDTITRGDKDLFEGADDMLVKDTQGATYNAVKYLKFNNMVINTDVPNTIEVTPVLTELTPPIPRDYFVYGVRINAVDSNPATATIFTDDCVHGMVDNFGEIPVMFKDGEVVYELDKNNFAKKKDGTDADLSGADGDVMIRIPKLAYMIRTVNNYIEVKVTNHPNAKLLDPDYCYYAFTKQEEGDVAEIYVGAYIASVVDNKLRSISNVMPDGNRTIGTYRSLANAAGYELYNFYIHTLLQCMYLVKYGNQNSQNQLGYGFCDGSSYHNTGTTNDKGMYYGTSGNVSMKFAGIEDWYGNKLEWFDGLVTDSNRYGLFAFDNFNDTGEGYHNSGIQLPLLESGAGYIITTIGNNRYGFLPTKIGGSATTYWCDIGWYKASCVAIFGGAVGYSARCGAFCVYVNSPASSVSVSVGGRVCFRQ